MKTESKKVVVKNVESDIIKYWGILIEDICLSEGEKIHRLILIAAFNKPTSKKKKQRKIYNWWNAGTTKKQRETTSKAIFVKINKGIFDMYKEDEIEFWKDEAFGSFNMINNYMALDELKHTKDLSKAGTLEAGSCYAWIVNNNRRSFKEVDFKKVKPANTFTRTEKSYMIK
jgi:hypothetical protein